MSWLRLFMWQKPGKTSKYVSFASRWQWLF